MYDYHTYIRIYLRQAISINDIVTLDNKQSHYLQHVMRKKVGDSCLVFNEGGEYLAEVYSVEKKHTTISIKEQTRGEGKLAPLTLYFSPVKNAPSANIIQKATELGVTHFQPVITDRTIVRKVNQDKLTSQAIEASEQCWRLCAPEILAPISLKELLEKLSNDHQLIFCDESGSGAPIAQVLPSLTINHTGILIGPEGGFSAAEADKIRNHQYTHAVSMGPRILRADTAALAAITCYQSQIGDWHDRPAYRQA